MPFFCRNLKNIDYWSTTSPEKKPKEIEPHVLKVIYGIKSRISQHHYTTLGKQRDIKWTSLIEPNLLDISIHIVILHVEGHKTLGTVVYWPVYAYQNTFTPFHLRWRVQISGVPTNDPTHHRRRRHDQVAHPSFLLADEKQKGSGRLDRSEKTQSNLRLRKQSTC